MSNEWAVAGGPGLLASYALSFAPRQALTCHAASPEAAVRKDLHFGQVPMVQVDERGHEAD